jgi:uncharacterized membrane protein YccC
MLPLRLWTQRMLRLNILMLLLLLLLRRLLIKRVTTVVHHFALEFRARRHLPEAADDKSNPFKREACKGAIVEISRKLAWEKENVG